MRTPSTEHLGEAELRWLQDRSSEFLYEWVSSSRSPFAVALKIAALAEFGLSALAHNPHRHRIPIETLALAQRVARYLYETTQEAFEASGTTSVRLYRGVGSIEKLPASLQSWTRDLNVAIRFDGYDVLQKDVPAHRILAYHEGPLWTGASRLRESEYLVLAERFP